MTTPSQSTGATSKRTAAAAALVAAVAFGTYSGTLGHGFALDDGPEVVDNAFIRSLHDVPRILSAASWAGAGDAQVPMYRPFTTLTYSLGYAVHGLAPLGFHLVNVLLHAGVSVLVLLLALRTGMPLLGALVAGLLFAVLPVHVEAVANVAGRKDLLVALFAVGAVLCHSRAVRRGGLACLAAPVLAALALLSKESALVLVGLVGAHDLLLGRDAWRANRRRAVAHFLAYAVLTVLFVVARNAVLDTLVFPRVPFDENPIADAPLFIRTMTAIKVLGYGIRLLVIPVPLSADYSFAAIPPVTSPLDPPFLASAVAILGLGALAFRFRKSFPVGAFAYAWYGISVLPASNLIVPIGTIFGERLLYLPSAGFALVAGAAAASVGRHARRFVAGAAVLLILSAYGAYTWSYARAWKDNLSIFSAATAAQPESAKALRMLGGALMEAGRPDEAAIAFERAVAIVEKPGTPQDRLAPALVELGVAFEKLGRLDDADGIYSRVLATDPRNVDAIWRTGVVLWQRGDRGAAIRSWERAVSIDPRHARALSDLGIAAFLGGDLPRAEVLWVRATEALPSLSTTWLRLGNLYERLGDLPRARAAWRRFLDTAPDTHPEARDEVLRKMSRFGRNP